MGLSRRFKAGVGLSMVLAFSGAKAHHSCLYQPEFSDIKERVPQIFNAMLIQESGNFQYDKHGNPKKSPSQVPAWGAAQVQIATGAYIGKKTGLDCSEQALKYDDEKNRACGQAYFIDQLNSFQCDVDKALAAYNAGPGRLRSAIRKAKENTIRVSEGHSQTQSSNTDALNDNWFNYVPTETKIYVLSIRNCYHAANESRSAYFQCRRPILDHFDLKKSS